MRLIRSAVSVGFFTVISRILGFIREWLQAHYLGVSAASDALNYAISFPSFFRRIFAEGALNASFIPLFTGLLQAEGTKKALQFAQYILSYLTISVGILVFIVIIAVEPIMIFILGGHANSGETLALTIEFTRVTFPFLFFISMTAFFSGVLNAFERFVAAASSPAIGNLGIIGSLLLLTEFSLNPGFSLAIGIVVCGIIQALWVFIPLYKDGIRLKLCVPRLTPEVKKFFLRMGPAALGASVFQINLIVDMYLSSYLPKGSFSYLKYADRFNQLPLSVIGTAIATALLPMMARTLKKGEITKALLYQNRAIEFTVFFVIPAMCGLLFFANDLIRIFYVHGEFTVDHIAPTAHTLAVLALGLPAYVLSKVFLASFFSSGDTRTPVAIGISCVVMNFLLNLFFIFELKLDQLGMAAATAVSAWANVLLLGLILRKKMLFQLDEKLKNFLKRMPFVTLFFLGYGFYFLPELKPLFISLNGVLSLTIFIIISLGVYVALSYLFGVFSWRRIKEHMSENVDT